MKIYRAKQLYEKTGMGKTRFWASVKTGDFPAPNVKLSERCVGWTSDVFKTWVRDKRTDVQQS